MSVRDLSVRLHVFDSPIGDIDLQFSADEHDEVLDVVRREAQRVSGHQISMPEDASSIYYHPANTFFLFGYESRVTVGEAFLVFGRALSAVPPTVEIHWGGKGDAGFVFLGLKAIASFVKSATNLARVASNAEDEVTFRMSRAAAREWLDTTEYSATLEQLIYAKALWRISEFMQSFGLSREKSPELLRLAGYVSVGNEEWIENSDRRELGEWRG